MKELIESENLESLALQLIDEIRHRKDAFSITSVIVPHKSMEGYFKSIFLKNCSSVLMNIRFLRLEDGLLSLLDMDENYRPVNKSVLREFILKHLSMEKTKSELPDEISAYLYKDGKLDAIQLFDLAEALSSLFLDYDKDETEIIGWQKLIYDDVMDDLFSHRKGTLRFLYSHRNGFLERKEKICFFGFSSFDRISLDILDAYCENHDVKCYFLKPSVELKNEISVLSAPSRMREIEAVHSEICSLLQKPENRYSDFLVLAPDISMYRNEIKRVFSQDNVNFPDVPYSINGISKQDNDMTTAFQKLLEIANKGYFTRLDFYELIHNPIVAGARGITRDDQEEFPKAILNMNVYRKKDSFDDFDYAKTRLLLSKLVTYHDIDDSVVKLRDDCFLPYHTIGFDDEAILRFVNLVDDLDSFIDMIHSLPFINPSSLARVNCELAKWFSVLDNHGVETNNDFVRIQNELYRFEEYQISQNDVPLMTLFYSLENTISGSYEDAPLFTKGITFTNYMENALLSAKYIFFLDASSADFPKVSTKSELDIRKEVSTALFESFLLQAENAGKAFYVSYVNLDLKNDEEFYPSGFLISLEKYFGLEHHEKTINLDETRNYETLFTKKEFKDKDYFDDLLRMNDDSDMIQTEEEEKDDDNGKTTISDIVNYLREPLQYKASRQFGRDDDVYERTKNEFEPFSLDNLTKSGMTGTIIASFLHEKKEFIDNADREMFKQNFKITHSLPDINEEILNKEFNQMVDNCQKVIDSVNQISKLDYEILRLPDFRLKDENKEWVLFCDKEFCRYIDQSDRYYFVMKPISNEKNPPVEKYLEVYAAALLDVASQESPYDFHVILKCGGSKREFDVNREQAVHTLNLIHRHMMNLDSRCFPVSFFEKKESNINNLDSFYNELNGNFSPWSYFGQAKLFEKDKLGYSMNDFTEELSEEKQRVSDEILFLHYEKMEVSEDDGE